LRVLAREPWRSCPLTVSFFGKGDCEEGLRRLAQRLGLEDRVRFCGQVDDIEGVWAQHHALVLPSRFEGLPITIVEAMHCGRPVIVTDVAGNAEVVQDGITGFVAEAPTERHLQAALERAWEQRHNWEKIGKAAARAIRELVPADPAAEFAQKLLQLAKAEHDSARQPAQAPSPDLCTN
jgi:glycosyltransferase involved in cell wall biosynthesis